MNLMGLSYALCREFPREIICYDNGISFLWDFFVMLYNFQENNALILKKSIIIVLRRVYAEISLFKWYVDVIFIAENASGE